MYAMTLDENRNFKWCEVADPVRKEGEVLIEVHAAAVNRADLMQKDGCYASPPEWPQWCGLEVSGIVLEAPADAAVKVGDKVCALVGGGGYSEKIAVPAGMVIPIPDGLSLVEAASIPEVWCTAYLNLKLEAGGMKPGDVFYMQAGASGVGLAVIQLAKTMGAKVITTIDAPEKAAFVKNLGADIVLDYRTDDVLAAIKANPPTVALDCIGGKLMGECFKEMVFGGRWIMIATMAGAETNINLETVWRKRIRLIGSTLRSRTNEEKCRIMQALKDELWPLFTARKIISNIHAVFPIAEVEAAHQVLRNAENIGKVVLTFK
ncbi:MAG: NAD(P)H-quinone oxidoreductase [Lentisphaeria bacterium]|nr:NAD(P)H-quinone oxidoreductase [Lentisphaeria bacterium]MBR4075779.1 NAD(P)H-quinone oxidoreductase [Lentisphaeria bacterium]